MGQRDKEQNPKLVAQTVPERKILLFFFFFLHATSWHRTKFPDTPLYRSSTDFSFFFTPPLGTERKSPTHCSIGPRPVSYFNFFFTTSWHKAEVFDALLKRSTQLCGQTNKKTNTTVRPQWTLTKASRPTPLSRDKQQTIGANSVNNFIGPQLAKQSKTGSRGNITLGNEK